MRSHEPAIRARPRTQPNNPDAGHANNYLASIERNDQFAVSGLQIAFVIDNEENTAHKTHIRRD